MEASWKGGCCEEQVVIVLGLHQCRGPFPRGPLPSPISTQCKKCGCWYRLYSIVGAAASGRLKLNPSHSLLPTSLNLTGSEQLPAGVEFLISVVSYLVVPRCRKTRWNCWEPSG